MANNNIKQISLGAYRVISELVGSETDVLRRQSEYSISDMLTRTFDTYSSSFGSLISSGSRAEGLDFSTSDLDLMCILEHMKVSEGLIQYLDGQRTFLLMENNITRPGFTFLRVISPSNLIQFEFSFFCADRVGDEYYLSNIKVKNMLYSLRSLFPFTNASLHGPCFNGYIGSLETDIAFCPRCDTWPTMAFGCITRLLKRGWPSHDVIKRIVEGGCLFVAVGSKGSQCEHLEWRMSFSLAEKELVHSMNHIQVMCYACLKMFLKEAINAVEPVKDLLCSYFLKTAVFWEIIEGRQDWTADTFLQCFWRCFTRLLGWVSNGYCPNFFIPQNNMFLGKIHGEAREQLFYHLSSLYSEGYKCLLRCASIRDRFNTVIERPTLTSHLTQASFKDKAYHDTKLIRIVLEMGNSFSLLLKDILGSNFSHKISHIMMIKNNDVHRNICELILQDIHSYFAFSHLFNFRDRCNPNNKFFCKLLRLMKRFTLDAVRYQVFIALYYLRYQMYDEALCSVHRAMLRLQNPSTMYAWEGRPCRYRAAGGNHTPLHVMMKRYVVSHVFLTSRTCMPELLLEYANVLQLEVAYPLPPLVLLYFIFFLCYHKKSDHQSAQSVLSDLSTLVCHDHQYHIPHSELSISHEILGICQEMYGDYQGALSSYMAVLNLHQVRFPLKYAAEVRIRGLIEKMR